jgi:hypothetical protein
MPSATADRAVGARRDGGVRARGNNAASPGLFLSFMNTPHIAEVPGRPASQWPIGIRLRFRPDAKLNAQYDSLRGKPLLVLSRLQLLGPNDDGCYSWRQQILSLSTGRVGWARPDQLALPVDEPDDDSF